MSQRGRVRTEPGAKRVRGFLQGRLVVDTIHPLLVWEVPYYPAYYLPVADVHAKLEATGRTEHSPSRGDGVVHDVRVGDAVAPGAALTFPDSPIEELRDQVRFDWGGTLSWFEEDEQVYTHPRDPGTRVDILPSSRHVKVILGGDVLADTTGAHVLFETGHPPRWYVPQVDVRMDRLVPSETVTNCPYKGRASHLAADVDGTMVDVAWTYPTPLPESQRVAGLVAFYDFKIEGLEILVDGVPAAA